MDSTNYEDDPTIADGEILWRRVCPTWIVPDSNLGGRRLSSQAFENSKDGSPMSVFLAALVLRSGRGPADLVFPGYGMVSITAGLARVSGQRVCRDPLPEEPAHALVAGPKPKSVRYRFLDAMKWVVDPR
jgi:hypothetical protein